MPRIRYTPWTKGVYDVSPALKPLGHDFGNGEADRWAFQFDDLWPELRANKLRVTGGPDAGKHVGRLGLSSEVELAALEALKGRLADEHGLESHAVGLEEFALEVPEDMALIVDDGDEDRVAFIHVCAPSGWRPADKLGQSFAGTHAPVPGMERVVAARRSLVRAMVERGPWVRFVWGVYADAELNHHPDSARAPITDELFVRVERQVTLPLPGAGAALFLIRVSFWSLAELRANPAWVAPLISGLRSMSPETRAYKGLEPGWEQAIALLARG